MRGVTARRLAEAFARRAGAYHGETRRKLDERLAILQSLAGTTRTTDAADLGPVQPNAARAALPQPGPLTALVQDLKQHPPLLDTAAPQPAATEGHPTRTTALVDYFRDTWTRIRADREWRQSQQRVPDHAGPLNSDQLVHRSLSLMRELSPGYLQQFLSHIDSLARLEQMSAAEAKASKERRRGATTARKPAAARTRRDAT